MHCYFMKITNVKVNKIEFKVELELEFESNLEFSFDNDNFNHTIDKY